MKKMLLTIISLFLVASLATVALADTAFGPVPPGNIRIIPDKVTEATHDMFVYKDPTNTVTAIGVNTKATNAGGVLEAKLMVDVDGDGQYDDVITDWGSTSIAEKYFTAGLEQTNIKIVVRGDSPGEVYLYTNTGQTIIISSGADQKASVTINTNIPEFPTVALPVAAMIGLLFIFGRKKEGL